MRLDSVELPLRLSTDEIERLCSMLEQTLKLVPVSLKSPMTDCAVSNSDLKMRAKSMMTMRRRRSTYFPENYFGDPVWDMVLDLFVAQIEGTKVSVTSLCIASNAPITTALRYISTLTEQGAIVRRPDPADGRRAHLELSDEMFLAMKNYLSDEAAAKIYR